MNGNIDKKQPSTLNFLKDFGPDSSIAKDFIKTFHQKFWSNKSRRDLLSVFEDWKRIFAQITGFKEIHLTKLKEIYQIQEGLGSEILFIVHTYYTLFIKLLAAELAFGFGANLFKGSHKLELEPLSMVETLEFKKRLAELENGSLFYQHLRIKDFVKNDCFSWYVDLLDNKSIQIIVQMVKQLVSCDLITLLRKHNDSKDFLKEFYMKLINKEIRRNYGEYYTPDWLAQFLLNQSNYTLEHFNDLAGKNKDVYLPLKLRYLDPACGSGTFLIEAIKRFREYADQHVLTSNLVEFLLKNVVGIDLNPLAVLAARTNFLLGIVDLLKNINHDIEIPVYMADSISFQSKENTNSPLFDNKFDYVIGNPPWVSWENLPAFYREETKDLWIKYGLFTLSGNKARLGGGKKDISMLFTYTCSDLYLKDGGILGFLITKSVFKSLEAGEGFRKFEFISRSGNSIRESGKELTSTTEFKTVLQFLEIHDFSTIQPFEGANTKTTAFILKKNKENPETRYPLKYLVWNKNGKIEQSDTLEEAFKKLTKTELVAFPSNLANELSPWLTVPANLIPVIEKVRGKCSYEPNEGINTGGSNGIYFLKIVKKNPEQQKTISNDTEEALLTALDINLNGLIKYNDILIRNDIEAGRKRNIDQIESTIENILIYPCLKSVNLKRWKTEGYSYVLQMQHPLKRVGFEEEWLSINFPYTYRFLSRFKEHLLNRSLYKRYFEKTKLPFYTIYNVGEHSYQSYKVVWNRMGKYLSPSVVSKVVDSNIGTKVLLPDDTLSYFSTNNEDEAHYLCAIMSSKIIEFVLSSISGGTKSFGTPKIVESTLKIERYNATNPIHRELSDLSKKTHEFALKNKDFNNLEEEINKKVCILYQIKEKEYQSLENSLRIKELKG